MQGTVQKACGVNPVLEYWPVVVPSRTFLAAYFVIQVSSIAAQICSQ